MGKNKSPHPKASPQNRNEAAARQSNDLGNGFARQGRFDEAAAYYQKALELDPKCAEAHNNLGNIFREKGKISEAAACYERATSLKPGFAMAHNNLGIVLRDLGRPFDAEQAHRRALLLDPRYAEAHFNLGNALSDQTKFEAAIDCYRCALTLQPGYAEAYINLGNALRLQGKLDEARESYQRAAAIRPTYAEAHHNIGNTFLMQDRPHEALPLYQRALALKPDYAEASLNLGNALVELGKHKDALSNYDRALVARPDYAEAHTNRALVNLCLGNFAEGWPEYEWRWHLKDLEGTKNLTLPLWDGKDLQGKTIILYCEQGLGDSLQFIRYASQVKDKGGRVFLSCPQPLARLFRNVAGIDQVFPEGTPLPACDCRAPLLSLPLFFNTRLETIPHAVPYLSAPPGDVALWADRLRSYKGLKVGLVWAGASRAHHVLAHALDRRRSLHLDQLAPLGRVAGNIHFFSLQKDAPAGQIKNAPPELKVVDFMDSVGDFADTAAFIANLDLVISVDTSVAHLAGAMGKPVWVLSRFDGCWRWLLERDDSPWYPTLRLVRQPQAGDWSSVIEKVQTMLRERVA